LKEVPQWLIPQPFTGEGGGRGESTFHNDALTVAQLTVTGSTENPVTILSSLQHLSIERKWQSRRWLATVESTEKHGGLTHTRQTGTIRLGNGPGN
jgi:hypothetical protein